MWCVCFPEAVRALHEGFYIDYQYRLKISLSLSEDKFVAVSTTQNKRFCLKQKFVLAFREEALKDRLLVGGNSHGKSS